ncbi:MAG: hypothetical protein RAO94_08185 [Candidatus Stygibacter australis]|nr:hypothetical protein [Candidatus Stygibacter australis]MDP8322315.1 hypothetical protein [Candidatus Stygibacter australis]
MMKILMMIINVIIILILCTSCSVNPFPSIIWPELQELTEQQKAVKIIFNNPDDNLKLKKNCEVVDVVYYFVDVVEGYTESQLRIHAVKMEGNVVEIMDIGGIYTTIRNTSSGKYITISTSSTSTHKYQVAIIYKCPGDCFE